jgi:putative DNA primase/helicase
LNSRIDSTRTDRNPVYTKIRTPSDLKIGILADLKGHAPCPAAVEAAKAGSCSIIIPKVSKGNDINDMAAEAGIDAVREIIMVAVGTSNIEWPSPQPLPTFESLYPVEDFDYDLLPEALRPWVADICERMQCPPDFVAIGAMVALSGAVGRKVVIRPKRHDNWKVVPNLWGACIGRPGVMKSPALSEAMAPLRRLEQEAFENYIVALQEFEAVSEIGEMYAETEKKRAKELVKKGQLDEAKRIMLAMKDGADKPVRRRFIVTDATVEALAEVLRSNPFGVLAYRDEISGLLRQLDRVGQESSRSFYLQAYDGNQPWVSDRIGRGLDLHIEAVCLSMLGSIQPGKLESYVRGAMNGGDGDDGLLQRFGLMVYPVIDGDWKNVDRYPDKDAKDRAYGVFSRLANLSPDEQIEMHFSPEAQNVFEEWRHDFEIKLRRGELDAALESHFSKYRKLVPAMALLFALADNESVVSETSLLRALSWTEYLQAHAFKVYAIGTSSVIGAQALLNKIRGGDLKDEFSLRDVQRHGWTSLSNLEEVRSAIDCLEEHGYLQQIEQATSGRPKVFCRINPMVLK